MMVEQERVIIGPIQSSEGDCRCIRNIGGRHRLLDSGVQLRSKLATSPTCRNLNHKTKPG
jgi:hypothetical protein